MLTTVLFKMAMIWNVPPTHGWEKHKYTMNKIVSFEAEMEPKDTTLSEIHHTER